MPVISNIQNLFLLCIAISLLLISVPIPGKFFRGVNTLVHEMGHALAAVLTQGEIISIELFADTSGLAVTKSKGKMGQFAISLSGYIFSSGFATFAIWCILKAHYNLFYFSITAIAILAIIFAVRNLYGVLWLILFSSSILYVYFKADEEIIQYVGVFISSLLLSESLLSTLRLMKYTFHNPKAGSDAYNLRTITGISVFFWPLLFTLQACIFTWIAFSIIYSINPFFSYPKILLKNDTMNHYIYYSRPNRYNINC